MIAISAHINQFAKALWQEALNAPYIEEHFSSEKAFFTDRYLGRFNRYRFVCEHKLTTVEGKEFLKNSEDILALHEENLSDRFKSLIKVCFVFYFVYMSSASLSYFPNFLPLPFLLLLVVFFSFHFITMSPNR